MPVAERSLTEVAANSEYTLDQLSTVGDEIEDAIQQNLLEHYKQSRLRAGTDYWVIDAMGRHGAWLAFTLHGLLEELRNAGYDPDPTQVQLVARAHLNSFQRHGDTLRISGTHARSLKDAAYYPIHVEYPEAWENGMYHVFQRFQEYIWRYEMSPSEALDYWIVEWMNQKPEEWGAKRGVQPEAVRKNVRQANEKLGDDELGAAHERARVAAVSLDEVPEDSDYDADEDVYYVLTEDRRNSADADDAGETA